MRNFFLNYFNFTTQMCICTIFFIFYFLLKAHRGLTKYPDFAVGWVNIHKNDIKNVAKNLRRWKIQYSIFKMYIERETSIRI